eukprot:142800-Pelagomonas_calceolata.AAC.5
MEVDMGGKMIGGLVACSRFLTLSELCVANARSARIPGCKSKSCDLRYRAPEYQGEAYAKVCSCQDLFLRGYCLLSSGEHCERANGRDGNCPISLFLHARANRCHSTRVHACQARNDLVP